MSTKQVNGVIVPRHDTAENWVKAINFVPKKGELIVYDADDKDPTVTYDGYGKNVDGVDIPFTVKSSKTIRFKFGDGFNNVNVLDFATTKNSGGTGEGGITEEEIIELIKENAETESAAIVYLNTKEEIGRHIELQDVYPIQAYDTKLKVISKNRIKFNEIEENIDGINVKVDNDGVKVTGSTTNNISESFVIGTVDITTPGKYTISVNNDGVKDSDKHCYIRCDLINSNGNDNIIPIEKLLKDSPLTIDSRELNCTQISIRLELYANEQVEIDNSEPLIFKVQVEYGESATIYTAPKDEINGLSGKWITLYGRNLYSGNDIEMSNGPIQINGVTVEVPSNNGRSYIHGVMSKDREIELTGLSVDKISVPLLENDKFTLSYTYFTHNMTNIQIVYGHVDYIEYEPFEALSIVSDSNGDFDISNIKYPYSFLALEDYAANEGYTIYLSYDPALSRNWVEEQLSNLNKRINTLESIIKSLTN